MDRAILGKERKVSQIVIARGGSRLWGYTYHWGGMKTELTGAMAGT